MDSLRVNRLIQGICTGPNMHGLSLQKVEVPDLLSFIQVLGDHRLLLAASEFETLH